MYRKDKVANLKVGMITCWYRNISIADYSTALIKALETHLDVKVVSAPCACWRNYVGQRDIFQSECEFSSFPPHIPVFEKKLFQSNRIVRPLLFFFMYALQLLRGISYLSKVKNCDIIHYQQSSGHQFGAVPLYTLFVIPTSKARVVTIHSLQPLGRLKFLYSSYTHADKIIVHSKDMKDKIISLGVSPSRIAVIPHGAHLPPLRGLRRKEVTFFGAPTKDKGFLTILKALKTLKAKGQEMNIHIYGIYSEEEKNTAIKDATRIGVEHLLIWNGRLGDTDFDQKLQESLFTLIPYSSYVSGSSVVARAIGNATPVIASNIGAIQDYLGGTGLLIEPNDSEQLSSEMTKLLADPKLQQELSEKERERAESFTWDAVANRLLQIYHEAMPQSPRRLRNRSPHSVSC